MADIIVTVPNDKVQLIRDMVEFQNNIPDMTDVEILAWVQAYFIQTLKRLVRDQQKSVFDMTFLFDDPIP